MGAKLGANWSEHARPRVDGGKSKILSAPGVFIHRRTTPDNLNPIGNRVSFTGPWVQIPPSPLHRHP
jgi:hypothetical protein